MAIAEFHFTANNSIGRMNAAMILTPEKKQGPFPVLYLLHGHSDDHTAWTRRSNIDRYVESLPLIVVMLNGERSWFNDALLDPSKKFESLIMKDLIPFVDSVFQTVPSRAGRAIAGLSMGGYGAMRLGLKYPDIFGAIHSFSGALNVARREQPHSPENQLIFGPNAAGSDLDPYALAERLDKATAPQIRFDCGIDDSLTGSNREFDQHLTKLGIAHEYVEYPGKHNWPYWNEHILDALPPILAMFGVENTINREACLRG